ncbi:hypothetical protein TNCV_682971 [Trichonephila clavipes]|nr:hypothetical protein TNCV_682971 [Trichonephila clavipes]
MPPLTLNGDSMRTWRNLGGRGKLASFLVTQLAANLATLVTFLASLVTMLASLENLLDSSRNLWRSPLTSRSMT